MKTYADALLADIIGVFRLTIEIDKAYFSLNENYAETVKNLEVELDLIRERVPFDILCDCAARAAGQYYLACCSNSNLEDEGIAHVAMISGFMSSYFNLQFGRVQTMLIGELRKLSNHQFRNTTKMIKGPVVSEFDDNF